MTTCRRYHFIYPGSWSEPDAYKTVVDVLSYMEEEHTWITESEVHGESLGVLQFSYIIYGRDQWITHRRAMQVATTCYRNIGLSRKDVPTPIWAPLSPHRNRGRWRKPAASA